MRRSKFKSSVFTCSILVYFQIAPPRHSAPPGQPDLPTPVQLGDADQARSGGPGPRVGAGDDPAAPRRGPRQAAVSLAQRHTQEERAQTRGARGGEWLLFENWKSG